MIRCFTTVMTRRVIQRARQHRGAAMVETAITLPLVILAAVAIFEFGHAFHTWEVLTNAAREGARVAVTPGSTDGTVVTRVQAYLESGLVAAPTSAEVAIDRGVIISGTTWTATSVTVTYPFEFMVLQPVVQLLVPASTLGEGLSMQVVSEMRNET